MSSSNTHSWKRATSSSWFGCSVCMKCTPAKPPLSLNKKCRLLEDHPWAQKRPVPPGFTHLEQYSANPNALVLVVNL